MIGYHYTSQENWEKIQADKEMTPYVIDNVELLLHARDKLFGIWIWKRKQDRVSHMGNIIRVLAMHKSSNVILLKINYEDEDILRIKGQRVSVTHHGNIENFFYHRDEPAFVLQNSIPIENIEVVSTYDLVQLLNG